MVDVLSALDALQKRDFLILLIQGDQYCDRRADGLGGRISEELLCPLVPTRDNAIKDRL